MTTGESMPQTSVQEHEMPWMRKVLFVAGIYNLLWGAFVVLFPLTLFRWAEMRLPVYPEIWQCVGMIVGVYGVGYIIAAFDPLRHWPIILVGLMGKILGPIGMANAVWLGHLPPVAGLVCATNDIIWWLPFGLILWAAYRKCRVR
jgi:hypothetical protein